MGLFPKSKEPAYDLDRALSTLGITEEEYDELISWRRMSKLDRAIAIAEQGDGSFKSFIAFLIAEYEKYRSNTTPNNLSKKVLLKMVRRIAAEGIDGKEGLLIVLAYLHYKQGLLAKTGDSDWSEVQ